MTIDEKLVAHKAIDDYVRKPEINDRELFDHICTMKASLAPIHLLKKVRGYSMAEAVWWLFEENRKSGYNGHLNMAVVAYLQSLPILQNMLSQIELHKFKQGISRDMIFANTVCMTKKDMSVATFENIAPHLLHAKGINVEALAQSGESAITTLAWRVFDKMIADFTAKKAGKEL